MSICLLAACLLAQPPAAEAAEPPPENKLDWIRAEYRADADKCEFYHDAERQHPLTRIDQPVMRWANDDDWSGDVFVWTHAGRPEVIGCVLSGPGENRPVFHEFHLLAPQPVAPADLQTRRRWQPAAGLVRERVGGGPPPAATAGGRLVQMRQMARDFAAHMQADGEWELRLLPQPLLRYGAAESEVLDGALFTYVWTKGTDPELILLLECAAGDDKPAWSFAPVRFSNRELWLLHHEKEVWRADGHQEPATASTSLLYTTAYARSMSAPVEAIAPEAKRTSVAP